MAGYNLGTARGSIAIDAGGLQAVQTNLMQTGAALVGFGTALATPFVAAVKTAAEFEKSMSAVKAVTSGTEEDIRKLREEALRLGQQGPFGPREVAESFVELAKAGLTTKEVLDGVGEATVNLASAGDLKLARSAEILSNTMRTFKLEAKDAAHITDVLAGAANASTIDVEDLAVSLKYAGGVASSMGISFEDTANALVILGNAGIKGSTGGTSLRRILLNLSPASAKAKEELGKLGIITEDGANQFFTAEGKAKSLSEVFSILGDATKDMTQEQKIASLNVIFGARAVNSALMLMEGGAEAFANADEAVKRATGAEVAAEKLNNLDGAIRKLKAALESTLIGAGTPFQNVLKNIVLVIRDAVLWFGKLPKPIQSGIILIMALMGVVAILGGAFFLTLGPLIMMIRLFAELPASLALAKSTIGGITGAFRALSASLLTNPVFLIIAAIVALGVALYALYQHSEAFRNFVDGLWQGIQKVWDNILGFLGRIPSMLDTAWEGIKSAFSRGFDWVTDNWLTTVAALVFPPLAPVAFGIENPEKVVAAVNTVKEAVGGLADTIRGPVATNAREGFAAITGSSEEMKTGTGIALQATRTQIGTWATETALQGNAAGSNFIINTQAWFDRLPGIAGVAGTLAGHKLGEFVGDSLRKGHEAGKGFLVNAGLHLGQVPGMVSRNLTTARNAVQTWGPPFVASAGNFANQTKERVRVGMAVIPGLVSNAFSKAPGAIARWIGGAYTATVSFATRVVSALARLPFAIPRLVGEAFTNAVGAIGPMVSRAFEAAQRFAAGLWNGFKSGLGINSPSYVEEAMFAMDANVTKSLASIMRQTNQLRKLRGLSSTLPFAVSPLASGALSPTASLGAATGSGIIVQGPLVEIAEAVVRDENDITKISRGLHSRIKEEELALGRKVL